MSGKAKRGKVFDSTDSGGMLRRLSLESKKSGLLRGQKTALSFSYPIGRFKTPFQRPALPIF